MNDQQRQQHEPDETMQVESEEQEQGKREIEVREENLPSRAAAVHEQIRMEGEKELERDGLALLWSAIAAGLSMGASLAALAFTHMPLFDAETRRAFISLGEEVMRHTPGEMFANGILAGWIIATMVWMFPAAGAAKIWVIVLMTYLVAICDLTHIVVGSVEILYLVFNGAIGWQAFVYPFALPTLAGNIIGGTFIFALISHAQIRNDLSAKNKAARLQEEKRRHGGEKP